MNAIYNMVEDVMN